jgi:CheY-like chemotaxis protein
MDHYLNNSSGKILLADDEKTFLESTSELLRKNGYFCDCANDGKSTLKKLSQNSFDIVVADIKMPGNSDLELIKQINVLYPSIIVILITAYPSQQTAIEAIGLRVTGYIVKPFDFNDFSKTIDSAIKNCKLLKIVKKTKEDLLQWISEMEYIELAMRKGKSDFFENTLNSFLIVNADKISDIFENIRYISNLIGQINPDTRICDVMQCPKLTELTKGIIESVASIQKTKELFKSKQLGTVREKLEKLLDDTNINRIQQ